MKSEKILEFDKVYRVFGDQKSAVEVLRGISFSVRSGEFLVVMGPSGSGKSTLLGIAAGLDQPDRGKVILNGIDIASETEENLSRLRLKKAGFIFQNFQLMNSLTAWENIALPLMIQGVSAKEISIRVDRLLEQVGMLHRKNHYPSQLSGGEEQRIAIARAFIHNPLILFADEPTANLDYKNAETIMKLMIDLNRKSKSTLIVVTHDRTIAQKADRIIELKDGCIIKDSGKGKKRL